MTFVWIPPEPIGPAITILQTFLAAHGQTAEFDFRSIPVRGTERKKEDDPPLVVVQRYITSDFPFGEGSGRAGVADYSYVMQCYGRKAISGGREASVLAGLVRAAFHNHPPVVIGTVGIHRARIISTGQPLEDPISNEPFISVIVGLYASSLEVAS
jgi:hypothetical protein